MSNSLITEVYKRQVGNMARNAVMALFADKAHDDGTGIWASKQRMADEIGASKQTVIATIKSLIADGLIIERGQRKSPNGYTVEYAIVVEALQALPLIKSHREDQSENLTGQAISPVNEADPTSQAALPHQSENLTRTPLNPPEPSERERRARSIPDDWKPCEFTPGTKSRAVVDGWPPGELETQAEHFQAHHRKKGDRFVDWQSAWSTWVLNNRNFGNGRRNQAIRPANGNNPDRRSSLARAIDEGIDWLGGAQAGFS